jgi:hypothetical protein
LIPLSNFHAKITAILDDGHEVVPQYEITATRGDERRVVSTPAEKFSSLSWLPKLPPRFNIHAGSTTRDRFRSSVSSRTTGARDKLEGGSFDAVAGSLDNMFDFSGHAFGARRPFLDQTPANRISNGRPRQSDRNRARGS